MKTPSSPPFRLSIELRERTREAHVAAEAAFDLNARLADLDAYGELLSVLRGFYGPAEEAIGAVTGWERLTPPLEVESRWRAALLDDDLRRLGMVARSGRSGAASVVPRLGSLAGALGCLYVLEGSTLGGQIVARRARSTLGEHLPVAFFSGPGDGGVGARWRAFQASLDAFGRTPGEEGEGGGADEAVLTALATFAALAGLLESSPVPV